MKKFKKPQKLQLSSLRKYKLLHFRLHLQTQFMSYISSSACLISLNPLGKRSKMPAYGWLQRIKDPEKRICGEVTIKSTEQSTFFQVNIICKEVRGNINYFQMKRIFSAVMMMAS